MYLSKGTPAAGCGRTEGVPVSGQGGLPELDSGEKEV